MSGQTWGGGGIPILEGSGELPCNLTSFLTFLDPIGVLFYEPLDLNDSPFLCKKIVLSLSHLIPVII